ncbi:MAG: hypothetical protein IT169_00765 [Bryobacterales bacterium]|nr:hypothetical protein [Bryobacterales bacterium]
MNSLTIEQSAAEAQAAFELHRNAQMVSVRLAHANLQAVPPSEVDAELVTLKFAFRAERRMAPPGMLRILVSYLVTAIPTRSAPATSPRKSKQRKEDGAPIDAPSLDVEASFEVDYRLRGEYVPGDASVDAFANGNAIFNVWPYFREFLQNMTVRMGHPPLTAPFLKLHQEPDVVNPPVDPKVQSSVPKSASRRIAKTKRE